jgi:hypothetical protein
MRSEAEPPDRSRLRAAAAPASPRLAWHEALEISEELKTPEANDIRARLAALDG